jgi:arabinofuranosyltransferase
MENQPTSPRRLSRSLAVWATCSLVLACFVWQFRWICDDAYISFRYSRNLVDGFGLRYNPTDAPIEGYSNLLWVLVMAAVESAGFGMALASQWGSSACAFLLMWFVVRDGTSQSSAPLWQVILAPLVLATLPPLALWATSGLATMPMVCAVFGAWFFLVSDPERCRWRWAALASIFGVLLRADAILFLGVVHFSALIAAMVARNRHLIRGTMLSATVAVATFAGQTLFRVMYHGDWMPNTARVKTGVSEMALERGFNYDAVFLMSYLAIPVALLVALVLPGRGSGARRLSAWSVVLATLAYCVYVGGDYMPMGRMLVLMLPFVAVLLADSLARLCAMGTGKLGSMLAVIITLFCCGNSVAASFDKHLVPHAMRERFHFRWSSPVYFSEYSRWVSMKESTATWTKMGKALKRRTQPGESLIIGTIGAVGFFSDLHIYDTFGLVNRETPKAGVVRKRASAGHDRHISVKHFLPMKPTYVGAELVPPNQKDYRLYAHLRPDYEFAPLIEIRFFPLKRDKRLLRLARWN